MFPPSRRSILFAALCTLTGLPLLTGVSLASDTETFNSVAGLLGPTSQPDSIALPSFNSNLGTLQSVFVTMQFNICPMITVENDTTSPISFNNLSISAPFNVSGPGGLSYISILSTSSISGMAAPGSTNYKPDVGWPYTVSSSTANLGVWENQPNSNIDLVVTPGQLVTKTGNSSGLQVSGSALEWENISVKYTYLNAAAVPEPSGKFLAIIVGMAMAVFALGRRVRLSS